jgi:hypothetical protein
MKTWREFDVILGNTSVQDVFSTSNPMILGRLLMISHFPVIRAEIFFEEVKCRHGPVFGGVSPATVETFSNAYGVEFTYTPFGVDTTQFTPQGCQDSSPLPPDERGLQRAGFVGRPDKMHKNKRPEMFSDICARSGLTPVFIYGRPVHDGPALYTGIDILISTSEYEAGPLGVFEAAAMGLPVLISAGQRGNAAEITGIREFKDVEEAVEIIAGWQRDPASLAQYSRRVSDVVRAEWDMTTLIEQHLLPLVRKVGTPYDFIEIGTGDFDTCVQTCPLDSRGLCVEPIGGYLRALPNKPHVTKVHAAVSDTHGDCQVFYLPPQVIEEYGLPQWIRGCNSIDRVHSLVEKMFAEKGVPRSALQVETVPKITFRALVEQYGVGLVGMLKIDTEGHDCIIMEQVAQELERKESTFRRPLKIQFETNAHTSVEDQNKTIKRFEALGYAVIARGHDCVLQLK